MYRFAFAALIALFPALGRADDDGTLLIQKEEADKLRERNRLLETERAQLKQMAEVRRLEEKLRNRALKPTIDALIVQLRKDGALGTGSLRLDEPKPKPPMLPEGVRGKVTAVKGGSVCLNIGIDAALGNQMEIDVYREERFLGTILIERVYPQEAVGVFKPARGKAIKDLKADELPKASDAVGRYYAKS